MTDTHRFNRFITLVLLAAVTAAGLNACAVNPATGQGNLVLMSENREKEIGAEEHQKVLDSMPLYNDPELLEYVRKVGNQVAKVSHRPDLEYQFNIIDSPEINAFALPGGYVYVNRGLLTFVNSEAELAAVLAHEVGHITARHAVQQHARTGLANVASTVGGFVTAVATGSGYIGSQISQVTSIWAQTGLSGFGREHELEADSLGAEYLYNAGYDPRAMIDVVTILKNQEDFNRRIGNSAGSYHGLFATHPRNDTRLQEAIASVGRLSNDQQREVDHTEFVKHIDGLVVGQSLATGTQEQRNRYYQNLLGYTLVFPDAWQVSETTTTVTARADTAASLTVEAQRLQDNIEPRVFIRDKLGLDNLQKSEPLSQYRLLGHTGVVQDGNSLERIAVIYLGPRAFIFRGRVESQDADELAAMDEKLLAAIRTFRAIQRGEAVPGSEMKIKYVQASQHFDFRTVAQSSRIANYPEETLRLLNGYYPTGSPAEGDWIKLVE
ncbi:MAG: hypothetical protein RLZZ385_2681 [Pseudomonadota bacterium]|jgi:predicted Zn-dependent protease